MRKLVFLTFAIILFAIHSFAQVSGTFTDSRDGKKYKTITIATQTWMSENLNFTTKDSWCYNDSSKYCDKYGRLYSWQSAKTACPTGWHLPAYSDWKKLIDFCGGVKNGATKLKSTQPWSSLKGVTNSSGFSAVSAGNRDYNHIFHGLGNTTSWWSANEDPISNAFNISLSNDNSAIAINSYGQSVAISIRCIKD